MGNKEVSERPKKDNEFKSVTITKNSFDFLSIIGKGGFGKVWKVRWKKNQELYAMKEMSKAKVIDKNSVASILSERNLLSKMDHPFIVNMVFSFQDKDYLYLAMDLQTGGDLRYHIMQMKRFSENQTRFFMACILLGYEYFHNNNIVHRDIKPENLVLSQKGYVKITDFGVAKDSLPVPKTVTSGTPGYMAPEVICAQSHGIAADYFALGVMGFEFMKGIRPYLGRSRKEIKEKILAHQVQIKKHEVPEGWSLEAANCINKLLIRKQANRLGYRGSDEVKNHPWFKDFPWADLYNMKLQPPYRPSNSDNFDTKYCNKPEHIDIETKQRYENIMYTKQYETYFSSYENFNRYDISKEHKMFLNPHAVYERNRNSICKNDNDTDYLKYRYKRPSTFMGNLSDGFYKGKRLQSGTGSSNGNDSTSGLGSQHQGTGDSNNVNKLRTVDSTNNIFIK